MQPPQNPYNQPNYGQPAPNYGAPTPQMPRGTVSLDVIGEGWKLLTANIGVWIGAAAIYLLSSVVFNILQTATQTKGANGVPHSTPVSFLISIISLFVTQFLLGGLMRMALVAVKGGKPDFSQLFSAGNILLSLVGAAIITGLAVGFGLLLCIIPGVIAAAGLMLVTPIIVDGRAGAIGALGESWNAIKPHLGSTIVLGIVLGLIMLVSMIPLFLGLLVTIPLLQICVALIYRDLLGGGAPAQNLSYSPPPIANPNF